METPTSRLLDLLELLQSRPLITGREIADRLGVDARTVRRYIATLEDLGVPVEGQRGVGGGYRIRPGYRLPPLMFDGGESVAVSLGLLAARRLGLGDEDDATGRALRKVQRVLPDALRRRLEALESTLAFTSPQLTGAPIGSATALRLAEAIHRRRRLELRYSSHAGELTTRVLSPYALVIHAGRWYLVAHDHGRGALRSFRADRCSEISIADGRREPPPDGFDAAEHVRRSFARVPRTWDVEVLLDLSLEQAAARLAPSLAELEPVEQGTLARLHVDSLDWTAALLGGLDCDLEIVRPAELRAALARFAARATRRARAHARRFAPV